MRKTLPYSSQRGAGLRSVLLHPRPEKLARDGRRPREHRERAGMSLQSWRMCNLGRLRLPVFMWDRENKNNPAASIWVFHNNVMRVGPTWVR